MSKFVNAANLFLHYLATKNRQDIFVFLVLHQHLQAETNWFYWVATFRYSTLKTDICWNWRFGSDMKKNIQFYWNLVWNLCCQSKLRFYYLSYGVLTSFVLLVLKTQSADCARTWYSNHLAPNLNHCSETHKFEFHGKRKVYSSGNINIRNCSNIILTNEIHILVETSLILTHLSVLYRFINSEFHLFCRAVPRYIYLVIDILSISTWIKKRKG